MFLVSLGKLTDSKQVLEYITTQLVNGYIDEDVTVTEILDQYDFYIFPIVNPDGKNSYNVQSLCND